MLAAKGGHLEVVKLVLQAGADKDKQMNVSDQSSYNFICMIIIICVVKYTVGWMDGSHVGS